MCIFLIVGGLKKAGSSGKKGRIMIVCKEKDYKHTHALEKSKCLSVKHTHALEKSKCLSVTKQEM